VGRRALEGAGSLTVVMSDALRVVAADPEMSSLRLAIDPVAVQRHFGRHLPRLAGQHGFVHVRAFRVTRYKPGRRCVIEYDVVAERPGYPPERLTLIGKIRRLRSGRSGYRLLDSLWDAGFGADAPDGVMVPEPIGTVPELRMWLQRKVPGRVATELLVASREDALARRIAEAAHKLHRAGVLRERERHHTMADELRILHERLPNVAEAEPRWAQRIDRILDACDRLGARTREPQALCGIHRDFYADQVLVDGDRLYLIDFDEYCRGDPALDIGNFVGAMTEQSLRMLGDPTALEDVERALEDRFLELSGEAHRSRVRAYATLTIVRHVYISSVFPERRHLTSALVELSE
jgi:aminoglycoside phosphotransferase (APT) family kinase protein